MSKSPQQRAKLRCCASCDWIYKGPPGCPKCGFGSYGAYFVYGRIAYKYAITQQPWIRRKMDAYLLELNRTWLLSSRIKGRRIMELREMADLALKYSRSPEDLGLPSLTKEEAKQYWFTTGFQKGFALAKRQAEAKNEQAKV